MHRCGSCMAQALIYARAAASVRACAIKLEVTPHGKLNCSLPFVAEFTEKQLVDITRTGTCVQLDQFRCGIRVRF